MYINTTLKRSYKHSSLINDEHFKLMHKKIVYFRTRTNGTHLATCNFDIYQRKHLLLEDCNDKIYSQQYNLKGSVNHKISSMKQIKFFHQSFPYFDGSILLVLKIFTFTIYVTVFAAWFLNMMQLIDICILVCTTF